jgi:CheY-like chemotaxis protein
VPACCCFTSEHEVNIRFHNDILAALDTETAEGLREEMGHLSHPSGVVGLDIDEMFSDLESSDTCDDCRNPESTIKAEAGLVANQQVQQDKSKQMLDTKLYLHVSSGTLKRSASSMSQSNQEKKAKTQPRISLFPRFEQQLAELKSLTTELIEKEEDPQQHEIILTQYAEAVLVILRQLRYLCMNCGLDGWGRTNLKRKILIVDDTSSTRKLVARAFENANFIVDTASNGAEGVKMLKESLYDIVFMDIEMPIMDGLEATKQLRSWEDANRPGARQPICALTGKDTNQKQLLEIKAAGIDVMEKKPCHIPRLFKVVDDVSPMFSDLNMNIIKAGEKS